MTRLNLCLCPYRSFSRVTSLSVQRNLISAYSSTRPAMRVVLLVRPAFKSKACLKIWSQSFNRPLTCLQPKVSIVSYQQMNRKPYFQPAALPSKSAHKRGPKHHLLTMAPMKKMNSSTSSSYGTVLKQVDSLRQTLLPKPLNFRISSLKRVMPC